MNRSIRSMRSGKEGNLLIQSCFAFWLIRRGAGSERMSKQKRKKELVIVWGKKSLVCILQRRWWLWEASEWFHLKISTETNTIEAPTTTLWNLICNTFWTSRFLQCAVCVFVCILGYFAYRFRGLISRAFAKLLVNNYRNVLMAVK